MIAAILASTIGRYLIITVVSTVLGLGGLAWLRYQARAPYQAQVTELKGIIVKRDQTAAADRKLAEEEAARAEGFRNELDKIVEGAAHQPASCRLDAGDLKRLRGLAGTDK